MLYAEVAVDAPGAERQTFTYSVPADLRVDAGHWVRVPFGAQPRQGIVVAVSRETTIQSARPIEAVLDPEPLISQLHIGLAEWIRSRYLSTPFEAVRLMLPPASGRRRKALFRVSMTGAEQMRRQPPLEAGLEQRLLEALEAGGPSALRRLAIEIEEPLPGVRRMIAKLQRTGVVETQITWDRPRVSTRYESVYRLVVSSEQAFEQAAGLRVRRAVKQADALEFLAGAPGTGVSARDAIELSGAQASSWRSLIQRGLVASRRREVRRSPVADRYQRTTQDASVSLRLTAGQENGLRQITAELDRSPQQSLEEARPFLLHGVTGSGKTEVYLRALEHTIALGNRGIVLVPEIALTPQTVGRFKERLPGRVAVLHSGLSLRDQYDEWSHIRDGRFDVVIGPRRAIFAPLDNIGLVVVDEEQEWSYKQDERAPRYHGRDVAVELARRAGAVAILGSATPDLVSMAAAMGRGATDERVLRLPERVAGAGTSAGAGARQGRPLASVEVVDLRDELRSGNRSIFSRSLLAVARTALGAGGQVILFVNRRGAGSAVQCRACGHALRCSRCAVSLTFHADRTVVCHQCGRKRRGGVPATCPICGRATIKPLGIGTERVVIEANKAFPGARIARWDRDAVRQSGGHAEILDRFVRREVDILVGTQMLAKGLDLPDVTVVGVVNADIGLNTPNFRAGERSFQILCQVAGRAGRGSAPGHVVIQTYEPDHYAVRAAAAQDYDQFYRQELEFRRAFGYPPFARMARLVYLHPTARVAAEETGRIADRLRAEILRRGLESTRLIGPSPAPVERLRGRYRWQIEILAPDPTELLGQSLLPAGWIVDVDPANVL